MMIAVPTSNNLWCEPQTIVLVELTDSKKCGGSLFIDQCLIDQRKYPNANRWDYAIDYDGRKPTVYIIENSVLKKIE